MPTIERADHLNSSFTLFINAYEKAAVGSTRLRITPTHHPIGAGGKNGAKMKRYKVTIYITDKGDSNGEIGVNDEEKGEIINDFKGDLYEGQELTDWEWEELDN